MEMFCLSVFLTDNIYLYILLRQWAYLKESQSNNLGRFQEKALGQFFFIFCFTHFFSNKLGLEDEIKIKIKFIRTIFQLN